MTSTTRITTAQFVAAAVAFELGCQDPTNFDVSAERARLHGLTEAWVACHQHLADPRRTVLALAAQALRLANA